MSPPLLFSPSSPTSTDDEQDWQPSASSYPIIDINTNKGLLKYCRWYLGQVQKLYIINLTGRTHWLRLNDGISTDMYQATWLDPICKECNFNNENVAGSRCHCASRFCFVDTMPLNFDIIRSMTLVCFSNRECPSFPAWIDCRYDGPGYGDGYGGNETFKYEITYEHAFEPATEKTACMTIWTESDQRRSKFTPRSLFNFALSVVIAKRLPTEYLPECIKKKHLTRTVIHPNVHTWKPTICQPCGITGEEGYGSGTIINWFD